MKSDEKLRTVQEIGQRVAEHLGMHEPEDGPSVEPILREWAEAWLAEFKRSADDVIAMGDFSIDKLRRDLGLTDAE